MYLKKKSQCNIGKRWPIILGIALLVIVVIIFIDFKGSNDIRDFAAPPKKGLTLILLPSNLKTPVNTTSTLSVMLNNTSGMKVTGVEIHLNYDPTKMTVNSITGGTLLPVVLTPGQVGNGTISITLGALPTNPVTTSGVIATITFVPLTNTQISFANTSIVTAIGYDTSVLKGTTGARIQVR